MSNKRGLYVVPKTLDAPTRILGLPIDEFVPTCFFAIFFFFVGKVILTITVPIATIVGIKMMKRGQGSSWIINVCYWFLPKSCMSCMLRHTPPSENREYIA